MTLKGDAKFKGKLTSGLKNNKEFDKFYATSRKFENSQFAELLLCKAYKDLDKKCIEELCLIILKSDAKFEENLTVGFKNDIRNLVYFNVSNGKFESFHLNVLLLPIVYKVSAKKVQKNYLS